MIELLKNFYSENTPRNTVNWTMYLNDINTKKLRMINRYKVSQTFINKGTQFLNNILNIADIPYLYKQSTDDFYIYSNYLRDIQNQLQSFFNQTNNNINITNRFIKNGINQICLEFLFPITDVDYLSILPMSMDYGRCKSISPMYLLEHDSDEYTLNILHGKIEFNYKVPTFAIFFLDPVILTMKYFKYYKHNFKSTNYNPYIFIHNEVYLDFIDQLQNIWLMKQHINVLNNLLENRLSFEITMYPNEYNNSYARFEEAIKEITKLYLSVVENNLNPTSIISSKFFSYKDLTSVRQLILYMLKHIDVQHITQKEWIRFIRDLPYLEYLTKLYSLNRQSSRYKNFKTILDIHLKRFSNRVPLNIIRNSYLRKYVEDKFTILSNL